MTHNTSTLERIAAGLESVHPHDPIAEAGRKVLRAEFAAMLERESGSRAGEDPEAVHEMRVATRRMRSLFNLLEESYDPAAAKKYRKRLSLIAARLGAVRDLDVLLDDLARFRDRLDDTQRSPFDTLIRDREAQREEARAKLIKMLDGKKYRRFLRQFSRFVTTPEMAAILPAGAAVAPFQVRHLLPVLIHERLSTVRAYDVFLNGAEAEMLHALRIECKRLRYTLSFFKDVLGPEIGVYIDEVKKLQDHLGRLNDVEVARERLRPLVKELDADAAAVLKAYLKDLKAERQQLRETFPAAWAHFNSHAVQVRLHTVLLMLD